MPWAGYACQQGILKHPGGHPPAYIAGSKPEAHGMAGFILGGKIVKQHQAQKKQPQKKPFLVRMQKIVIFGILFFFIISSVAILVNWEQLSPSPVKTEASSQIDTVNEEIKRWESEVAKDKNNSFALRNLGYAYLQANKLDTALSQYKKAAQLDPKDDISDRYLCQICVLKGYKETALKHIDKALELKPYTPELIFNRATILAAMSRYDESVKSFKEAKDINPQLYSQGKFILERYLELAKKQNNKTAISSLEGALKEYERK